MKLVSATILLTFSVIYVTGIKDYYRDEEGQTYIIGTYGNRVYEDENGSMIDRPNKKRDIDVNAEVMTNFGWGLFNASNIDAEENFVISSLPPQMLLSLINKESQGETKRELTKIIGSDGHRKLSKLVKQLTAPEDSREFSIATSMFINDELREQLKPSYMHESNKTNVELFFWNFKNPKTVQTKYNQWLKTQTNGVIKSQAIDINRDSKMIMSTAMYFKGDWIFEFVPNGVMSFEKTETDVFKVESMKSIFKKYHYGYTSGYNAEWLSIPYNSTEALIILLPNRTNGVTVDDLIRMTPTQDIVDIIDLVNEPHPPNTLVNITMPKFKIDSTTNLKTALKKMGVTKLFERDSEFFPLFDKTPLQVSSATQQCSLEVNEKGSVGASVTKFSIVALSIKAPVEKVDFVVDRPFVAIVINRLYRMPYFLAKVSDPRSND